MQNKRIAIVYDRVNKWGGAERILLALHKIFPEAPLFTSVYESQRAEWAKEFIVYTSFLQKIPFAKSRHELFALCMPIAFEDFNFDKFDVVISVTSEAAKGILTKPQTKHVCICLTPTRYLWSGYKEYFNNSFLRWISKPAVSYLRAWDKIAAQRPDVYIAISKEVKGRIKRYYERESTVVYPPLTLKKTQSIRNSEGLTNKYFLVVSRLSRFTQYKRVDLAVKACTKFNLPLIVVGDGDIEYFKHFAGKTVSFTGKIPEEDLVQYYKSCKALIFPGKEDFGLTMVEAQSFGKPVIAYKAGGALEIVKEGQTGEFFVAQNVSSLAAALKSFCENDYNSKECIENAQRFTFERFEKEIKSILDS